MNDVEKWFKKQEMLKVNIAKNRENILIHKEEETFIGETFASRNECEDKYSADTFEDSPLSAEVPQAIELTLGDAITDGANESGRNRKDNLAALKSLQGRYALFSSSDLSLIDLEAVQCGELTPMRLASGRIMVKRYLSAKYEGVDQNAVLNQFLVDPKTTIYKGVTFCPVSNKDGYLNLWKGPTLKPEPGTWVNVKYFLLNIICGGDNEVYEYLVQYLAHALQKPEHKPGVMLSMLGGQGIGKGTLMKIIILIWGATTYKTNRIEDVVGNFNAAIEGKLWILLDEAQFAGDFKATDALKSIITEPTVSINAKFQSPRMIDSLCRVISATNQVSIGKRDTDDRRDLTLKVSEKHKGDHAYWENLNNCLEQETAAMMHDLLRMDLGSFNVYNKPNTNELTTQKINSLTPEEAWWLNSLRDGALVLGGSWGRFVKTKDIADRITEYRNDLGHRKSFLDPITLANNLMTKWCKSAEKTRSPDATRHRGFMLPTLKEARQNFEETLGGKVDWED